MNQPTLDLYQTAVQSPQVSFGDGRLKDARPVLDPWGLPFSDSGGFAIAFRLRARASSWAVRCFARDPQDLEARYQAIAPFTASVAERFLVPVEFLRTGIRVSGRWWPVTVMPWVDGKAFGDWIGNHVDHPHDLQALGERFRTLIDHLDSRGVAHGDLQHGNIIVRPDGSLVLIDYDSMFVPGLERFPSLMAGHPNYRHPERDRQPFGPSLDRFSAIVIWSALNLLKVAPGLWATYDNGENLLFVAADFANPEQSHLFQQLRSTPKTADLAEGLRRVALAPASATPTLNDFIAGRLPAAVPRADVVASGVQPYPVVDVRSTSLDRFVGQRVTALGEVVSIIDSSTVSGQVYRFVVIGTGRTTRLRIVIWSEVLGQLHGTALARLSRGHHVVVTGLVSTYSGTHQIVLERASLFEEATPARVTDLLGHALNTQSPTPKLTAVFAVGDVVEHQIFGRGTVLRIQGDVAHIQFGTVMKSITTAYPMMLLSRTQRPSTSPLAPVAPTKAARPPAAPAQPARSPGHLASPVGSSGPLGASMNSATADQLNKLYGSTSPPRPAIKPTPPTASRSTPPTARRPAPRALPKPTPAPPKPGSRAGGRARHRVDRQLLTFGVLATLALIVAIGTGTPGAGLLVLILGVLLIRGLR